MVIDNQTDMISLDQFFGFFSFSYTPKEKNTKFFNKIINAHRRRNYLDKVR